MKLHIDTSLFKFISENANRNTICAVLYDLASNSSYEHKATKGYIATDINWIRRSIDNPEMMSYLPVKKYNDNIDPFEDGVGRMQVKTGKFINKLLTRKYFEDYNIKDKDIENFVNLFKAESTKYEGTYFKVVEGYDINKYYSCDRYFTNSEREYRGTIWQSCMRHQNMYDYFNIYADNCKMLVLFTAEDKVMGRALLWDNVTTPTKSVTYKFMDRIYYYEDSDVELFKRWASDNGYITKMNQDAHTYNYFIVEGKPIELELQTTLVKTDYEYYPYLDTFKFLCCKLKYLRNFDRLGKSWTLVQTQGGIEELNDEGEEEYHDEPPYEDD